jgi:hypothetical protein
MGRYALVTVLALSLSVPVFGAASSALPVSGFAVSSGGTVGGAGRIGEVPGSITSTATSPATGDWTMTVGGTVFATGVYSCSGGCTYTGTVVGSKTAFSFSTTTSRALSSATGFTTHGGWVATVGHWAAQHRGALAAAGLTVGNVVATAAHSRSALADRDDGRGADHGGDHGHGR